MSNASVYEDLRAAIASGDFAPQAALTETDLMARFEAGRPAVRVALARLEQEGLVELRPRQTARVRLIDSDEALEIAEARSLLERRAAEKAAAKATEADVSALRALVSAMHAARGSGNSTLDLDQAFHQRILQIAGDVTLARMHSSLHGHLIRFHIRTMVEQAHASSGVEEHQLILDAVERKDEAAASAAMGAHLDRLADILRRSLAKMA